VLEVSQGQSTSRTAQAGLLCAGVKQTSDGPGLRQGTEVCQTFPRSFPHAKENMKAPVVVGMAVFAWLLAGCTASAQQTKSAGTQHPASKTSGLPDEDRLRMRLQFHPHDADAHKELIKLLDKKYAFRAIVAEDTTWLSNNRSDLWALNEIVSYSENALHDPEYAIVQLRLQLSAVPRKDDPEDFDDWSDQLAAKLQKRGRPREALPLLSELVRLNPNEAGFWADYGDVLSALGQNAEAAKAFRRSIELNPSMDAFHEGFAEALVKSGDLSGAESEYRAALSIYDAQYKKGEPTDSYHSFIKGMVKIEAAYGEEHALAETRMKLAHILLLEKKYEDALVQARSALDADHNKFSALYLQAEICDAKGDHNQANEMRNNAAATIQKEAARDPAWKKNKPDIDPRVLFLSDTLWNGESGYPAFPSEIVSILEPRIASLSGFERVELGTAYFALGRMSSGKQQWEKAIASNSEIDNAVSHSNLGEELLKAGALDDALPHLRRAYELDPQNSTFRMGYDIVRQRLGQ
jgi:tetratricopeptide (TPR) repeat protein